MDDGSALASRNVAIAVGFSNFPQVPPELAAMLPAGRWSHTCDTVDLAALRDKRVLIVGGRQSAFEWAAILADEGAARCMCRTAMTRPPSRRPTGQGQPAC